MYTGAGDFYQSALEGFGRQAGHSIPRTATSSKQSFMEIQGEKWAEAESLQKLDVPLEVWEQV